MDHIRILDQRLDAIRADRKKLDRKAKLQEARDLQLGVMKTKTLENELKAIQRERAQAEEFNKQFLLKVNEATGKDSGQLSKSGHRLNEAKMEFAKMIKSEYPNFNQVLNEPFSFQKQILEQNLEEIRKKRTEEEMKLQKETLIRTEILQKRAEYLEEVEKEKRLSIERERQLLKGQQEEEEAAARLDRIQKESDALRLQMEIEERERSEAVRRELARPVTAPVEPPKLPPMEKEDPYQRLSTPDDHMPMGIRETLQRHQDEIQRLSPQKKSPSKMVTEPEMDIELSGVAKVRAETPKVHELMAKLDDRSPPASFQPSPDLQPQFHLSQIVEPVERPTFGQQGITSDHDLDLQLARVSAPGPEPYHTDQVVSARRVLAQESTGPITVPIASQEQPKIVQSPVNKTPEIVNAYQKAEKIPKAKREEPFRSDSPMMVMADLEVPIASPKMPIVAQQAPKVEVVKKTRQPQEVITKQYADDDIPLAVIPQHDDDIPFATLPKEQPITRAVDDVSLAHIPVVAHVMQPDMGDMGIPIAKLSDRHEQKVIETPKPIPVNNVPVVRVPPIAVPIAMVPEDNHPVVVASSKKATHIDEDEEIVPSYTPEPRQRQRRGTPLEQRSETPQSSIDISSHIRAHSNDSFERPLPSPPSAPSVISSTQVEHKITAESEFLQQISQDDRIELLKILMRSTEARFCSTPGTFIDQLDENITNQMLENRAKQFFTALKRKQNLGEILKQVTHTEMIMLMFAMLHEHSFPVFPVEISRKKKVPQEFEVISRLSPDVRLYWQEIRGFLDYLIQNNFMNKNTAIMAMTNSILNYNISRNQFKRTEAFVKMILLGGSRPNTAMLESTMNSQYSHNPTDSIHNVVRSSVDSLSYEVLST